jgi:hypothetical protein
MIDFKTPLGKGIDTTIVYLNLSFAELRSIIEYKSAAERKPQRQNF